LACARSVAKPSVLTPMSCGGRNGMINHRHDCWVRLFSAVVKGDARSASHLSRVPRSGREERATDDESVARRRAPSSSIIQECRWSMLSFSRTPRRARDQREIGVERITWTMVYVCAAGAALARGFKTRVGQRGDTPSAPRHHDDCTRARAKTLRGLVGSSVVVSFPMDGGLFSVVVSFERIVSH
jgi:hypothetical protein